MTETPEQKAKRILDMQCTSTRAALTRPENEDRVWRNRPNPFNWLAVSDAKDMDEAVAGRSISFQESEIEEGLRRKRGQMLSDLRGEHNNANSITPEKRQAAVAAFMFVKMKFYDLMKACGLATEKEVEFAKRHEK